MSLSSANNWQTANNPFSSFWMAGYECTDQLNASGNRVDFLQITGHLQLLHEDYQHLSLLHIKTVREGIRWSRIEQQPYQYDWSTVATMIAAAREHNIQQVWDICHFGFPDDLTPLHPLFARRFAALCRAFVRFYRSVDPTGTLIITPINEVSFLSWLGGDVRGTSPYCTKQGWEVKYCLMKAYIEGIAAAKEEDATVRILTTEPLVNMVPPLNATVKQLQTAKEHHESQFQVLEILSGRMCPELKGRAEYLDILGFNFYYNNQWVSGTSNFLPWLNERYDIRWKPLSRLLGDAYRRYQRPFVLTETSHPGIDRPGWMRFITEQSAIILRQGLPFWGICWYPILDRPDWDNIRTWHHSGLWDAELQPDGFPARILHQPTATALWQAQQLIDNVLKQQKNENELVDTI